MKKRIKQIVHKVELLAQAAELYCGHENHMFRRKGPDDYIFVAPFSSGLFPSGC
jgi:hypothetical protein